MTGADYLLDLAARLVEAAEKAGIDKSAIRSMNLNSSMWSDLWVHADPPQGFAVEGCIEAGGRTCPYGDLDLGPDERMARVYFWGLP